MMRSGWLLPVLTFLSVPFASADEPVGKRDLEPPAVESYGSYPGDVSVGAWDRENLVVRRLGAILELGPPIEGPLGAAPPPERSRGGADWADVYRRVAPSVVFLAAQGGHGTGFLLEGGWIVTNHHVASAGVLDRDRERHLNAYLGRLDGNGVMVPDPEPRRATVFAWDRGRDVALLRLDEPVEGRGLALLPADVGGPTPGSEVALIGNAGLGLLWAMKPGFVSAVGRMSDSLPEMLTRVDRLLGAWEGPAGAEMEAIQEELGREAEGWIGGDTLLVQATAATSPGDSGGPLLDREGRVVGIAMGLRADPDTSTTAFYFVHHREIAALVAEAPERPLQDLPTDLWRGPVVEYRLRPDEPRVLLGSDAEGRPVLVALDLDGDTDLASSARPFEGGFVGVHPGSGPVATVAVTREGYVLGLGADGELLWDRAGPSVAVGSASGEGGRLVAIASGGGDVELFATESGELRGRTRLDPGVHALTFDADGSSLWTGSLSGAIARLSSSGEHLGGVDLGVPISALAADPRGGRLAVSFMTGGIVLLDLRRGAAVWQQEEISGHTLRFHPDGGYLVASPLGYERELVWLSASSGAVVKRTELEGSPYAFELSPTGDLVAADLFDERTVVVAGTGAGGPLGSWTYAEAVHSGTPVETFRFDPAEIVYGGPDGALHRLGPDASSRGMPTVPVLSRPDTDRVRSERRFDAEVALVIDSDSGSTVTLWDLDGDGLFERIRVDDDGDRDVDTVYRPGEDSRWIPGEPSDREPFLAADAWPEELRPAYEALLAASGLGPSTERAVGGRPES